MKTLFFGFPQKDDAGFKKWVAEAFNTIEIASREDADVASIAQDFTVSNFTETRTLNAGTATATDVANVLATLIDDIKSRGMKRTS